MNPKRRTLLLGAAAAALAPPAFANDWPSRPIRLVVPFAAGGPTDFIARLLATPLSQALGQPVVIENRPGASGNLGAQNVLDGEADGYTLLHNTVGMQAVNPLMYPQARFQPARDFVPIATTAAMPNVLVVHPGKLPVKSLADLIRLGKASANGLTYATFGAGTSPHIYGALLQKAAGFRAVAVPYKGSSPALTDVMAGQVDFVFDSFTTCIGQIQGGKLRPLAITASQRSPLLPDVPTLKEAGYPDVDLKYWFSLQAPAQTPKAVIERLRAAAAKAVNDPGYIAALRARGAEPMATRPAELAAFVRTDAQRWTTVARDIGIKPE
ncbi:ABC transporter substrate-binding protein [Cupriavidus sp. TA19]|uniref:Bug family tripartite tricarboxylate transporter substrate binding protein n=1 Tax=unclassified Cupriavidus TaxID=2640874 RepID=UPI000E2EC745|nr:MULTISPECIES: tripartite tricarboxylate transporter substrate binding protein [unclassified Cupriavidus]BDB27476.1 tripartite tricarboxylate transporter substrate binding protein [Cupriavidus sp. P-10]GLC93870.1 ABC transporter substrate-binding protein [Cupriavidus sp. TA19]